MGKRMNIYLKDDNIIIKLMQEENMSGTIEKSLQNYYNQSLKSLEEKEADLKTETKLVRIKIDKILNLKKANEEISKNSTTKEKELESKKMLLEKIKKMLINKEISNDEYSHLFDNGKLNYNKAKRYK